MPELRDVHVLLLDTFADWELGFTTAHLNRPAMGVPSKYRVRTVGLSRSPVRSLGGLSVLPDLTLDELSSSDSSLLLLPGSDAWADTSTDPVLDKARAFVAAGVPVAAICGATFGLARAGLLDERRHTGNDAGWLASSGYRGSALYVSEPAVDDGGVITASATASLDFARLVLARLSVFTPRALDAWFELYKTGEPARYFELMAALEHERA